MTTTPTEQKLQRIVARLLEVDPDRVDLDRNLIEESGLDSFDAIQLLHEIEVVFPDIQMDEIIQPGTETIRALAQLIDAAAATPDSKDPSRRGRAD